jgi:hypothetical protein
MAELFEAVVDWPTLLLLFVVFGFAPGFVLRLLVMVYPRDDPRRRKIVDKLYTYPYWRRPLFVAEQLERTLFEGVPDRAKAAWQRFGGGVIHLIRRLAAMVIAATTAISLAVVGQTSIVSVDWNPFDFHDPHRAVTENDGAQEYAT